MLDLVFNGVVVDYGAIELLLFAAGQFSLVHVVVPVLPHCLALLTQLLLRGISSFHTIRIHFSIQTNNRLRHFTSVVNRSLF